jgi:hypothetical protein
MSESSNALPRVDGGDAARSVADHAEAQRPIEEARIGPVLEVDPAARDTDADRPYLIKARAEGYRREGPEKVHFPRSPWSQDQSRPLWHNPVARRQAALPPPPSRRTRRGLLDGAGADRRSTLLSTRRLDVLVDAIEQWAGDAAVEVKSTRGGPRQRRAMRAWQCLDFLASLPCPELCWNHFRSRDNDRSRDSSRRHH